MKYSLITPSIIALAFLSACAAPQTTPRSTIDAASKTAAQTLKASPFDRVNDIGEVSQAGTAIFDKKTATLSLTASGANIWGKRDDMVFTSTEMSGDLSISSAIDFVGDGVDPHRKAGVMIRQSMAADSPYIDVVVHGDGLTSLQYRDVKGGETYQLVSNVSAPDRVKLELIDGYAYMSVAAKNGPWVKTSGSVKTDIKGPYFAGLALSAHNNTVTETAKFSSLELTPLNLPVIEDTGYGATS